MSIYYVNCFSNNKCWTISDREDLQILPLKLVQMQGILTDGAENIVEKSEIAFVKQFLLFLQCFRRLVFPAVS